MPFEGPCALLAAAASKALDETTPLATGPVFGGALGAGGPRAGGGGFAATTSARFSAMRWISAFKNGLDFNADGLSLMMNA